MGAYLGEFGDPDVAPADDPDYFTFRGAEFQVRPEVGAAALTRFAWQVRESDSAIRRANAAKARARTETARAEAQAQAEEAEFGGLAAVHDLMLAALGPDELARFGDVADAAGSGMDELMKVANQVFGAIADRPTRRPSDSSGGPSNAGTTSTASPGSGEPGAAVVPLTAADRRRAQMAEVRDLMEPLGVVSSR